MRWCCISIVLICMTCGVCERRSPDWQGLPNHLESGAGRASLVEVNSSSVQQADARKEGRFIPSKVHATFPKPTHSRSPSPLGNRDDGSSIAARVASAHNLLGITLSMAMNDEVEPASRSEETNRTIVTLTAAGRELENQHADPVSSVAKFLSENMFDKNLSWHSKAALSQLWDTELRKQIGGEKNILILSKEGSEIVGSAGLESWTIEKLMERFSIVEDVNSGVFDKAIAMIIDGLDEDVVAVMSNVAVRKDKRGQGIARELLRAAETNVRALGYQEINIMVTASNEPALQLYESSGYSSMFSTITNLIEPTPDGLAIGPQLIKVNFMRKRLSSDDIR